MDQKQKAERKEFEWQNTERLRKLRTVLVGQQIGLIGELDGKIVIHFKSGKRVVFNTIDIESWTDSGPNITNHGQGFKGFEK